MWNAELNDKTLYNWNLFIQFYACLRSLSFVLSKFVQKYVQCLELKIFKQSVHIFIQSDGRFYRFSYLDVIVHLTNANKKTKKKKDAHTV